MSSRQFLFEQINRWCQRSNLQNSRVDTQKDEMSERERQRRGDDYHRPWSPETEETHSLISN